MTPEIAPPKRSLSPVSIVLRSRLSFSIMSTTSKSPHHVRESVGRRKSPSIITDCAAPPNRSPREWVFLDRLSGFLSEDIRSVFKEGAKVRQRQLVNEMLGPIVTEFARILSGEGTTPTQRGFKP